MKDIALLVAGGQEYGDDRELDRVLSSIHAKYSIARLIHGDAPGADRMAGGWANLNLIPVDAYPIEQSDGALPHRRPLRRNQRMLDTAKPQMGVFFPGGPGTKDMLTRCLGKIPCLIGLYTGGAMRLEGKTWVRHGPSSIGWKLK